MKKEYDLNPVFETICLLGLSDEEVEQLEDKYVEELGQYGVDAAFFWQKHCKAYSRYVKTFHKYEQVRQEDKEVFQKWGDNLYALVVAVILYEPEILEQAKSYSTQWYQKRLITGCHEQGETGGKEEEPLDAAHIVKFVDETEFKADDKWNFLMLLQNPEPYFIRLARMVRENLGTYEKARQAVEKPLEKLLERYRREEEGIFARESETEWLYPTFAAPVARLIINSHEYCGLLIRDFEKMVGQKDAMPGVFLSTLKILSDHSKMEIIALLKKKPMYGMEIAQALNLTSATVSHHMSALISRELVTVRKKDGKLYYYNNREVLEEVVRELEQNLLG